MNATPKSDDLTRDLYQEEYTHDFVNRWDELINWKARWESEQGFFQDVLRQYEAARVLDAACGTGFHTVMLARDGFNVVGADGSPEMVRKAQENARRAGISDLPVVQAEWTRMTDVFPEKKFDAIVCLGNAFTHLFEEEDRKTALGEFRSILNDDGVVIIDHRNYDKILDREFESKHQHYYLGESVDAYPEEITEEFVRMRYQYADGSSYHLTMCPIRQNYVTELLRDAGFQNVRRYGDFDANYRFYEPDFIIQVGTK
jgi:2-polyprenyl-3-methyl-5-hydroxy-6-metoxy-1,4-benzoquinol methylase